MKDGKTPLDDTLQRAGGWDQAVPRPSYAIVRGGARPGHQEPLASFTHRERLTNEHCQ